ncbi:MAG: nucleotidyltransferase domain-containing protein [Clostridiales bacterium]|nr:nucleotidyltransferase domain-containing protein [Clostridiales bacterium]
MLQEICRNHRVDSLYLFGSRSEEVRHWLDEIPDDSDQSSSDIDVGIRIEADRRWTVEKKVSLALDLEEFFGCRRVDLVLLNEADPFLATEIIRGERVYAQNEQGADEYDLYVLRRAGDLARLEKERMALIFGEAQ